MINIDQHWRCQYMSKKYDIFISYRRAGGIDSAVALQSTLRQMHYRAFLDVDGLHSGVFDTALLHRIEECKDFLLVLSPGALERCKNDGDWVRREVEYALSLGKNIIPIICDGGTVQERLADVELPDSMAELTRYNVLETNLVQLQAMTQLLRTNLSAKPHDPVKPILIGAAAAAAVCVLVFFCAGFVKDYLSVFPRTTKEKNLVEQAISQQSMNLVQYDVAHAAYIKALDKAALYLSGSPQVSRSELSTEFNFVLDALEDCSAAITDADPLVTEGLADSPLSVADMNAQSGYLRDCLDQMYSVILFLEYEFLDDEYTLDTSKSLWISCYRDLAVLEGDTIILGINEQFLPVSEEALRDLRTISLPLMTSIYTGQTWVTTADDADMRSKNLYERQKEIMNKYDNDLLKSEAMLENERKLQEIQAEILANQRLDAARARLEAKRQELAAAQKELEEAKARLYEVHKPLPTDDPDLLFMKGLMFTKHKMIDAALECYALYGLSSDPNAAIVADAVSHFTLNQDITGINSGVIVLMYEENLPPQPEIQIGDIIYTVNGKEIANVEEYNIAKDGNAASDVQVLRFTSAGYERLNIQLDPNAGRFYLYALEYE